jgi:uncharacterized protein YggE
MEATKTSLLVAGIVAAVLLSIFAVPWQSSDRNITVAQEVEEGSSSLETTIIRVAGESSKKLEPDQVTMTITVQTDPSDFQNVIDRHREKTDKVMQAINTAAGEDSSKLSVRLGQTYLNPYYSGAPTDNTKFTAYASVPIKMNIDQFRFIAETIAKAGFRVESLYVQQVPVDSSGTTDSATVTIVPGSSDANNPIFYEPSEVTVQAGTLVRWFNKDSAAHTVTSGNPGAPDSGAMFDSGLIRPGESFEHAFTGLGTYSYFCQLHPWKIGKVTVTEGAGSVESGGSTEMKYEVNMNIALDTLPDSIQNTIKNYQTKIEALIKILEENGIAKESIQQSSVSFNPFYYGPGQYSLYNEYTQIFVKTDAENMENIAKAAQGAGANVETIFLSVSDATIDRVRSDLTQQALENAKSRAMEIADPMGLQIKGIKRIDVNADNINPYGGWVLYRGVKLTQYYDPASQSGSEVLVSVTVEFETGK